MAATAGRPSETPRYFRLDFHAAPWGPGDGQSRAVTSPSPAPHLGHGSRFGARASTPRRAPHGDRGGDNVSRPYPAPWSGSATRRRRSPRSPVSPPERPPCRQCRAVGLGGRSATPPHPLRHLGKRGRAGGSPAAAHPPPAPRGLGGSCSQVTLSPSAAWQMRYLASAPGQAARGDGLHRSVTAASPALALMRMGTASEAACDGRVGEGVGKIGGGCFGVKRGAGAPCCRTHRCWRSGAARQGWTSPAPGPSRARRGGNTPRLPAFLRQESGMPVKPPLGSSPGIRGRAGGSGRSLASLHVDAVGREVPLDAIAPFRGSRQRLLLEAVGKAGARGFPPHRHGAAGHADGLEAEIWDGNGGCEEWLGKELPRGIRGARRIARGRYLRAALPAHGAAVPAPARQRWPPSAGFRTRPRTG